MSIIAPKITPRFNPRSPWGERRMAAHEGGDELVVSIHAPRGGSDDAIDWISGDIGGVSIHAPRGGSDADIMIPLMSPRGFNPRSPWGERHR